MALLLKKGFPRRISLVPRFFTTKQYDFSTQSPSHHRRSKALPRRTMDEEKERRFRTFRETLRFIDCHNLTTQSMEGGHPASLTSSPEEDDSSDLEEDSGDGEVEEEEEEEEAMFNSGLGERDMFESFVIMSGYKETPEEKEKMFQIFRKFLSFLPGRSEGVVVAMFKSFIAGHEEEFCNTPPEDKEKMFHMFRNFLIFMDNVNPPSDYAKGVIRMRPCGPRR